MGTTDPSPSAPARSIRPSGADRRPTAPWRSAVLPHWRLMSDPEPTVVYTDGACSGNPGPGGWAWVESPERSDSGGSAMTTNNRMELTAVDEAIRAHPGPLVVVTDSTYVKNGLETWSQAWVRNGWRTKDRKDVKNRDLWEPLVLA